MREVKKAEKAAMKRDQMKTRREASDDDLPMGDRIATADDMAGYGLSDDDFEKERD